MGERNRGHTYARGGSISEVRANPAASSLPGAVTGAGILVDATPLMVTFAPVTEEKSFATGVMIR